LALAGRGGLAVGSYLPLITGSGGALVTMALGVWLFFAGKIHSDDEFKALEAERDYWRDATAEVTKAMEIERRIVNETAQAGQVNVQLIRALTSIAEGKHQQTTQKQRRRAGQADLGSP
jgi:hypothetical protein